MKFSFDPLLWIIYGGVMISYQNESFSSSFLSTHMDHNFDIQESMMGLIFAVNNLGQLVSNVCIGFLLKRRWIRRKNLINIGFLFQIASCIMFIAVDAFKQDDSSAGGVLALSLVSRVINGLGIGVTLTIFFAYIPLYYPDEVEEKISGMEIAGGVGLCIGPLFTGYLYQVGYIYPWIYSIAFTGSMIPVVFFYLNEKKISIRNKRGILDQHVASILDLDKQPVIVGHVVGAVQVKEHALHDNKEEEQITPEKKSGDFQSCYSDDDSSIKYSQDNLIQNVKIEDEDHEEEEEQETDPRFTSIFDSIKYLQIFMPFCMIVLANALCFFLDPTLAQFMFNKYHQTSEYSGIIISLKDLVYIVACPCCTLLQKKISNQRLIIYGAGIMIGVSMFLFGPNHLFTGLPKNEYVSIAASIINGASSVFVFLPSIQVMIDNLESIYEDAIDDEQIGNVSSMLFNSAFSVGGFLGPMLAGVLVEAYGGTEGDESGFEKASATYGFFMIAFAVLYIILGKPPQKSDSHSSDQNPNSDSTGDLKIEDEKDNLKQKLTQD